MGAGNLRLHGWSGGSWRIRCLRCASCGADFSERADTPLFALRTSEDTRGAIARHLPEGRVCRATARLCGVALNTVLRFPNRFGKHAEHFHESQVRGIQPKQVRPDEAWSFVGKKDKHCDPLDPAEPGGGATQRRHGGPALHRLLAEGVGVDRRARGGVRAVRDARVLLPEEIACATVQEERESKHVVAVTNRVVLGGEGQAGQTLAESERSGTVNTSSLER
jgi:hypothetical protein